MHEENGQQNISHDSTSSQEDVSQVEKERDEYLEGWKRAKADFLNYKKKEEERVSHMVKFSNEQIIKDMLHVLDSFDLALETLKDEAIKKGVFLIRTQLEDALKKHGLEKVMISEGQEFDPSVHEAIASIPSQKPPGAIVDEVERGYMLHGKLIRPARVKVSKGNE